LSHKVNLKKYHEDISRYVASKVWFSLMANEIVEKSIRSLPLEYGFKIEPSKNIFFKKAVYSTLALALVFILIPALVIFYYFFFSKKKLKKIPSENIVFLRNNLTLKRYLALKNTYFISSESFSIIYDDFLNFYPSDDGSCQVPLSGYLSINPNLFIKEFFVELKGFFYDFFENSPKIDALVIGEDIWTKSHINESIFNV